MISLTTAALLAVLSPAAPQMNAAPALDSSEPRLLRQPSIKGDTVVFTYAGDLWVAKTGGGTARRLTSSNGQEVSPRISPDGKWVAFTATYDGNADVYVIPIEGGEPKRLTYDPEPDLVSNWTPDGKIAYVSQAGNFTNRQQRLWIVDPRGGISQRTVIAEAANVSYFASGDKIAYNRRNSYNFNWRRYRGGTQGVVSIYDFKSNKYEELPTGREQNYWPMVVKDSIYYLSDKNLATLNLYRYDIASKKTTQLTRFTDADIKNPSTDGASIVYERDGLLYRYDLASNQIENIKPTIVGENLAARPYLRDLGREISDFSLSPSGARLVVAARGELFSVPAKTGDTRNISQTSGAREALPVWSPDGKSIAYVSDESGEKAVYVRPQMGGTPTKLIEAPVVGLDYSPDSKLLAVTLNDGSLHLLDVATKKLTLVQKPSYGISGFEFSPDSKWVAFASAGRNRFGAIQVFEIATGKTTAITSGRYDDSSPTWDQSGKYLYFISARSFNPGPGKFELSLKVEDADRVYAIPLSKDQPNPLFAPSDEEPVKEDAPKGPPTPPAAGGPGARPDAAPKPEGIKIDFDGIESRAFVLPWGPGTYRGLVGVRDGVIVNAGGTLNEFSFGSRESTTLMNGLFGAYTLNASRTKIAYYAGGILGVVDLRPGVAVGQGRVDVSDVQAIINPRDEWKQMYWETWRYVRDEYYDPNLRGLNWKAIGDQYAKYLPYINHRSDLNYVIGLLIGETGTGHSYVSGGDFGTGPRPIPVGNLGADYEVSGNNLRFKKIYRGDNYEETRRGPLGEPGVDVRDHDFLLEIDGKPVTAMVHPDSLMYNKIGKFVTLTVNDKPTLEGARKVRVRPIATEGNLRYLDFVETSRKRVEQLSGGRIGYMHIPNTAFEGSVELIRGYYSQTDKDAVLVDERWNGGGYIQPWFVDTLARRKRALIQPRHGQDWEDAVAIEGPKALLINSYAGSGGDFFPWMFRQSKLGPLIGTRTWGGLVGINGGLQLVDGGTVNAPAFAIYDRDTFNIIAENTGIDPDIEVDMRPDDWAKGYDAQLEAGVKYLMEQLAKEPKPKVRTGVPTVGPKGRVGG